MNIYHTGDFNQNVFHSIWIPWYENFKDNIQIFKLNVKYIDKKLLYKCLFPCLFYMFYFLLIFKAKLYSSIVVIHLVKQLTFYLLQQIKQICLYTIYANFFFSFIWTLHLSQKPLTFALYWGLICFNITYLTLTTAQSSIGS